jgi:hypothetical protein
MVELHPLMGVTPAEEGGKVEFRALMGVRTTEEEDWEIQPIAIFFLLSFLVSLELVSNLVSSYRISHI